MTSMHEAAGVTTILRIHDLKQLNFLGDALASICFQSYDHIRVLIAIQSFVDEEMELMREFTSHYSDMSEIKIELINFEFISSGDHRAELLNRALQHVDTRYVTFLDPDDVLYPNAFQLLVDSMLKSGRPISVGKCVQSEYVVVGGSRFVRKKREIFLNSTHLDFLNENIYPIHSYMIDLSGLERMPEFWHGYGRNEDYKFLLELAQMTPFQRESTVVCEYYIDQNGSNTILAYNSSSENLYGWRRAISDIEEYKRGLDFKISYTDVREAFAAADLLRRNTSADSGLPSQPSFRAPIGFDERAHILDIFWMFEFLSKCGVIYKIKAIKVLLRGGSESFSEMSKLLHSALLRSNTIRSMRDESFGVDPTFDEGEYLRANKDVAESVGQDRRIKSGYIHYLLFGKQEGRSRPLRVVEE